MPSKDLTAHHGAGRADAAGCGARETGEGPQDDAGAENAGTEAGAADAPGARAARLRLRAGAGGHDVLHRADPAASALHARGRVVEVRGRDTGGCLPLRHAGGRAAGWVADCPAHRPAGGAAWLGPDERLDVRLRPGPPALPSWMA